MRFQSRVFQLAKDADHPEENQDACQADAGRGIAAIADGVATGIFARRWARILTQATVAQPPQPDNKPAFQRWLAECRQAWASPINPGELAWFQKAKLRQGAFSTLLWVEVLPLHQAHRQPEDPWRLRAFAIGDSCLFHVRQGKLLRSFPLQKPEELDADPLVIGSIDRKRDQLIEFKSLEDVCWPGDLLVLCTDAIAQWALRRQQAGDPPAWEQYWTKSPLAWQQEIIALRNQRQMRHDDATLMLLRISGGPPTCPENQQADVGRAPASADQAGQSPVAGQPAEPDWAVKLKLWSDRFAEQLAEQLARGARKLKEVKQKAESAWRRYRQRPR